MQYIYDSEAVSKLIEITEEIYLRYIDIIDVKEDNKKNCTKEDF